MILFWSIDYEPCILFADKPPIEELHQFLEFQLPRQWAPVFGELAVGPEKQQSGASLQFSFMGPKLYVNSNLVIYLYVVNNTCDVFFGPILYICIFLFSKTNHVKQFPKAHNSPPLYCHLLNCHDQFLVHFRLGSSLKFALPSKTWTICM